MLIYAVGMLLAGLLLRNVPYVTDAVSIDTHWSAALRNIALSIILTRAGLGLDPSVSAIHTRRALYHLDHGPPLIRVLKILNLKQLLKA